MQVVYEHPGTETQFPYLLIQDDAGTFYKVLLRNRFLFVSTGSGTIDRDHGELDIPFVGAERRPVGDFVYDNAAMARSAFERFRDSPGEMVNVALAGRKP